MAAAMAASTCRRPARARHSACSSTGSGRPAGLTSSCSPVTPAAVLASLVEEALARGGNDNATGVLVRVDAV